MTPQRAPEMGRQRDHPAGIQRVSNVLSPATRVTLLRAAGDQQHLDDLCHASGISVACVSGARAM